MRSLLSLSFLLAACSTGAAVDLTIDATGSLSNIAALRVTASQPSRGVSKPALYNLPAGVTTIPPAQDVGIRFASAVQGPTTLLVEALSPTNAALGSASTTVDVQPGRLAQASLTLVGDVAADLGVDASAPDLATLGDLAGADLSGDFALPPGDLSTPPDMATCALSAAQTAWVDPALGSNDASHGAGPGACAFKTITYALAHATAKINLKSTGTYQSSETFPLVLTGAQILDGDPTASGTQARIVGLGNSGTSYGVVILTGTANQVVNCDLSVPVGAAGANSNACVQIKTTAAHLVDRSTLHDCGAGVYSVGVELNSFANATITNSAISNVQNCLNGAGSNVTLKTTTCSAIGYYVNNCGSSLVACGDTNAAGGLGLCNGCTCPGGFTAPCP